MSRRNLNPMNWSPIVFFAVWMIVISVLIELGLFR
jgi:hypothetical protein